MNNALVLVNAAAGRGHSRRSVERVLRLCAEAGVEVVQTSSPEDTVQRARQAADAGFARVIAVGGDGTAHHVLNGVAGTAAALGIIPVGSGNDVARNLGLPLDAEQATRLALTASPRRVDLARIAGDSFAARSFAGVASFGLDSHANRIANRHTRLRGTTIYIYAMLRTLLEWRVPTVTLESDGGEFRGPMMLAVAANAPSYGGGMRIAPRAQMADGRLDVCIVREMSRLKLLRCFPEVFRGTHLRHPEVSYLQASRMRIQADRPLDIFADGEFVGHTPAEVELLPGGLTVVAPEEKF